MSLLTYSGNYHCGQYRYTFKHSEITEAHPCNCSYCSKQGFAFLNVTDFETLQGTLKEYRFGSKRVPNEFCETCGTPVLARPEGHIALNVRLTILNKPMLTSRSVPSKVLTSGS